MFVHDEDDESVRETASIGVGAERSSALVSSRVDTRDWSPEGTTPSVTFHAASSDRDCEIPVEFHGGESFLIDVESRASVVEY
ncbi:hypothetical protein [Natranaeroarchaeum aerophilus]|uniref:Uncharacterized protein n=1 Tax=Natranaeroarchaeum aerophilus TaxID=2917711 RepID=A0AAE3K341_9EURY|nr:hypothetical protein [Natranaeroarchaeum aerophilus]MCL9812066.1 hypothetical protein [Natranaeroarchaeum aerophilus]